MRTVIYILLLLLSTFDVVFSLAPTPHIDWCLYWRFLNKDVFRPECNGIYKLRFMKYKAHDQRRQVTKQISSVPWTPARPVPKFNSYINSNSVNLINENGFGECRPRHTNCQQSGQCASGQLCIDVNGYCCGSERVINECPAPDTLVSHCAFRRRHVNWCQSDSECAPHLAPRQNLFFFNDITVLDSIQKAPTLCCPTQCGYNVCVR